MMEKLVIIGSGMAAARLLQELALRDADFDITVIGEEPQPSYNRILLSSILCGDKTEQDIRLLDDPWYLERKVKLHAGDAVVAVHPERREVATGKGAAIPYDHLVFATGSRARIPDIAGCHGEGVMGFRSLADLSVIRGFAAQGGRAVVVGGGLLGLEAAHGLDALGMTVTVVHRNAWLMNRQLDAEAGALLQDRLEQRGIGFCLNASPHHIVTRDHRVCGLALCDGEELAADLVLFAAGIEPRDELARAANIHCDKAIVADRFLCTSAAGIYALGECCEIEGRTFGLVAPVYQQAICLADKLCRRPTAGYCYSDAPTLLKVSGIDLFSAGELGDSDNTTSQFLRDPQGGVYRRLVFRGDRLVGAVLLGDKSGGVWYDELIRSGQSIAGVRPRLMFGQAFAEAA